MSIYRLYNPGLSEEDAALAKELYHAAYVRAHHPDGNKRQLLAMIAAEPRGERLKQLKIPALVMHGDVDPAVSLEHGKRLAECLVGSRFVIFKGIGHGLPKRIFPNLIDEMATFFSEHLV